MTTVDKLFRWVVGAALLVVLCVFGAVGFYALSVDAVVAAPLKAPKLYSGPYAADVVRVVDADTVKVRAHIWPNNFQEISIRVYGIDTPEKRRPKCAFEKKRALEASALVEKLLPVDSRIHLTGVLNGKFAGRAVATVRFKTATGSDDSLGDMLIRRGHAVPYFGGKKTKDWCASP